MIWDGGRYFYFFLHLRRQKARWCLNVAESHMLHLISGPKQNILVGYGRSSGQPSQAAYCFFFSSFGTVLPMTSNDTEKFCVIASTKKCLLKKPGKILGFETIFQTCFMFLTLRPVVCGTVYLALICKYQNLRQLLTGKKPFHKWPL